MKYYIFFILLIISFSCNIENNLNKFVKTYCNNGDYIAYVLIPSNGCSGCISVAEDFLMNYSDKFNNVMFFIVSSSSNKTLKIRFGKNIFTKENVKLIKKTDIEENVFKYPIVIYLNSNQIERVEYQSPDNNAIENLKNYAIKNIPDNNLHSPLM
jgi:hypothetical protein